MTKYYLDEEGLERLVSYINDNLAGKVNVGDQVELPKDLVHTADLADYALKSDIPEDVDLSNYATKAELEDYATDSDIERLEGLVTGVYHFRGSVADLAELQAVENPAEGDVYNIADTGMNAAWTGEMWMSSAQLLISQTMLNLKIFKQSLFLVLMKYYSVVNLPLLVIQLA